MPLISFHGPCFRLVAARAAQDRGEHDDRCRVLDPFG
jgi:hypothetical protein